MIFSSTLLDKKRGMNNWNAVNSPNSSGSFSERCLWNEKLSCCVAKHRYCAVFYSDCDYLRVPWQSFWNRDWRWIDNDFFFKRNCSTIRPFSLKNDFKLQDYGCKFANKFTFVHGRNDSCRNSLFDSFFNYSYCACWNLFASDISTNCNLSIVLAAYVCLFQ